jgi:hypothetical protein
MRIFPNFPSEALCPLCRTAEDKPCILIPIAGTTEGSRVEALPTHLDCCLDRMIYVAGDLLICLQNAPAALQPPKEQLAALQKAAELLQMSVLAAVTELLEQELLEQQDQPCPICGVKLKRRPKPKKQM